MRSPDVPILTRVLADSRISQRALKTAELPIDPWRNKAGELSWRAFDLAERYKLQDSDVRKTSWVDVGNGDVKLAIQGDCYAGLPRSQVLVSYRSDEAQTLLTLSRGVITDSQGKLVSLTTAMTVIDYIQENLQTRKVA